MGQKELFAIGCSPLFRLLPRSQLLLGMKKLRTLLIASLFGFCSSGFAEEPLVFGMAPTMSPLEMDKVFGRLTRALDDILPQQVVFRTRKSRDDFYSAFNNKRFDIVLIHPFDFLQSDVQDEYLPVVRKSGELRPIFVATNKNIRSLKDTFGKKIGYPTSSGFVYRLGEEKLLEHGINSDSYQKLIFGDFNSCLQSVANQSVDACLTIQNLVLDFTRDNNIEFHTIGETDSIPHVTIFVRRLLSRQLPYLQQQLLALNGTEKGRRLLNSVLLDKLEVINLEQLEKMKNNKFFINRATETRSN